ncbi:MAG: hypothetical protein ABWZ19_10525 [Hyphomicrobium sp.]
MSSVRTLLASLSTTLGGVLILASTGGLAAAVYVAKLPPTPPASGAIDAVASRPLVKADRPLPPMFAPVNFVSTAMAEPVAAPDRGARIRQLQKALVRAACYAGPISGVWSNASQDAMRGFVQTVNAELPVDHPDDALVALIESNEMAKCAPGRAIATGTLATPSPAPEEATPAKPSAPVTEVLAPAPSASDAASDGPPLVVRAWAPAGMLIPSKTTATDEPTTSPPAEMTASNDPPAATDTSASPEARSSSTLHFEGGAPLPAVQPADPAPVAAAPEPKRTVGQPPKAKKTRTVKRRPVQSDGVEATLSNGFDSLQKSISSMF